MALDWKLDCTRCEELTDFEAVSDSVVRCADCGKRHSYDSTKHV